MPELRLKNDLSSLKQADIAALFGVTDRTIQRWHERGLPRQGDGKGSVYVWADVLAWYVGFVSGSKSGPTTDKDRKLRAEADLAEMAAAEKAGQLLDANEVKVAWTGFLARVTSNLDGFPDRAAEKLEDGMNLAEKAAVIRRELAGVRRDLVAEAGTKASEVEEA